MSSAWLPQGDAIRSATTRERGIALELFLTVSDGFSNPSMNTEFKPSSQNPVGFVSFVFQTQCRDSSCVLYFVEVIPAELLG